MHANEEGCIPIPDLPKEATRTKIFRHMNTGALLSLGQLCDNNCDVLLSKNNLHVFKNNKPIMKGLRNRFDGLWDVNVPINNTQQTINIIIPKNTTKKSLIQFYHAACSSPAKATFIKAIKSGNFSTWPGLTVELATKFLEPTIATHFGHLKQERMNLQSTRQLSDQDYIPTQDCPNVETNEMIATVSEFKVTKKAYGDLPGRFPITSSRGTQYFLVIYHYDSNAILVRPLRNRTGKSIATAYMDIFNLLKSRGIEPKTFILDNETSTTLLNAFENEGVKYQLVPPHMHRRNAAERAIQSWKEHFIAGLSSLHPEFPMLEWDRLIDQGMMTLNMLRNARVNPNLSAYEYIFGHYNFSKTPIAPPGMKMVVHSKPSQRGSWDPHGMIGFYVGPALQHYRCFRCYIASSKSERITDTVVFLPHNIKLPSSSPEDIIQQYLDKIIKLLTQKQP